MKKIIFVVLSLMFIVSCSFFLQDSSEWSGPHAKKGQADGDTDFGEEDILGRRKVKQQISGYSITMPEDMEFRYGSTVYDTDKLFGKKRKYLYDNRTKTGTNIYLIEETIGKLISYSENDAYIWKKDTKKNGRYEMVAKAFSSGVFIEIKPNLYVACNSNNRNYMGTRPCEAIVKVMKSQ